MEGLTKLFEPGKINKMELRNRVIMAPLGHGMTYASKPDGLVTDQFIAFYAARAKGGVGFIQLTVAGLGRPFATGLVFSPGILSLVDDEHIPSGRRFTDAMHAYGTKVSFQLTHHGAAIARAVQRRPPVEYPELMRVVSSSGSKDPSTGFEIFSMTREEIKGLIGAFGQAAKRGQAAGFDAVRIQGCHTYLIQQFLSPRINKRTDEYGGSVENRARLGCEIIQKVREAVGPDFPIIIRMNGSDHVEGGITLEDAVQQAKLFEKEGADALDISSGPTEAHHWQFITMYQPSGALVELARTIKKAVRIPVITVGKIDLPLGEEILRSGSADYIQFGRALMTDPELVNKARLGGRKIFDPAYIAAGAPPAGPRELTPTAPSISCWAKNWKPAGACFATEEGHGGRRRSGRDGSCASPGASGVIQFLFMKKAVSWAASGKSFRTTCLTRPS